MKPLYLIAVSALALTTAGCGSGPPKARAALDCPQTEGDLTRTSASPDGKACTYVSSEGAEVTLQLVSVQGGPDATLKTIEDHLLAQQPVAPKAEATEPEVKGKAKPAAVTPAAGESAKDAAAVAREAAADAAGAPSDDEVSQDAKSEDAKTDKRVSVARGAVIVDEKEGRTRVTLPGVHIDADDEHDTANIDIGPLHVNAGEGGAEIRVRRDVRLRGEQLSREKRGLRATFISEKEGLADNAYRFVAYEAGGPKVGPLTVAVVKAKTEVNQGDDVYKAVRRLVRRNGGV